MLRTPAVCAACCVQQLSSWGGPTLAPEACHRHRGDRVALNHVPDQLRGPKGASCLLQVDQASHCARESHSAGLLTLCMAAVCLRCHRCPDCSRQHTEVGLTLLVSYVPSNRRSTSVRINDKNIAAVT
eukprot:jgi/Ulvmu1/998/UM103_0026.1